MIATWALYLALQGPARQALADGDYAAALRLLPGEVDALEALRVEMELHYQLRDFASCRAAAEKLSGMDAQDPRPLGLGLAAALWQQDARGAERWLERLDAWLAEPPESWTGELAAWRDFATAQRAEFIRLCRREEEVEIALSRARTLAGALGGACLLGFAYLAWSERGSARPRGISAS